MATYALSAAGRITRASKALPAFVVPERTSPPAEIVTGTGLGGGTRDTTGMADFLAKRAAEPPLRRATRDPAAGPTLW